MSKKRLPNSGPIVNRIRHKVEEGFVITARELTRGMDPDCVGKTRQGRINNSAYHIKKAILAWADAFPKKINGVPTGFTPAVRDVFKALAWALLMDRGYAVFSYDGLADTARCDRSTAHQSINYLRKRGLLQFKTGKGWEQKQRRNLANQYTVNLWAFINPETGEIIDPPYHTGTYEWELTAAVFRSKLKNPTMVTRRDAGLRGVREKANHSRKFRRGSDQENGVPPPDHSRNFRPYKSNGKGGASLPASADAAASAPPPENQVEPLPTQDSDSVKVVYAQVNALASQAGIHWTGLVKMLGGVDMPTARVKLLTFLKSEIVNYGKATAGALQYDLPNGVDRGRLVVEEGTGTLTYVEDGIALADLTDKSLLAIEYRISETFQVEIAEKLQKIATGI